MKQVRMWVDPEFKKLLKKEAAEKDTSILDLSRELAQDGIIDPFKTKNEKKKWNPKF